MAKQIPVFRGTETERLEQAIKWVKRKVRLRRWTNQEIGKFFSKRTPREILDSGHAFYMNSCLDRTLVLMETLKANDFKPKMVSELLSVKGINVPHFALEMKIEGKTVCAQFIENGLAAISDGYKPFKAGVPGVRSIEIFRDSCENFSIDKNYFQALSKTRTGKNFSRVNMDAIIEKMKMDNTLRKHSNFKAKAASARFRKIRKRHRLI